MVFPNKTKCWSNGPNVLFDVRASTRLLHLPTSECTVTDSNLLRIPFDDLERTKIFFEFVLTNGSATWFNARNEVCALPQARDGNTFCMSRDGMIGHRRWQ